MKNMWSYVSGAIATAVAVLLYFAIPPLEGWPLLAKAMAYTGASLVGMSVGCTLLALGPLGTLKLFSYALCLAAFILATVAIIMLFGALAGLSFFTVWGF